VWGLPASVLSDNGAVYTAAPRNGRCAFESELLSLGITYKHSRPYHPQTCGKVERFHQTLKKHLTAQPAADSPPALQEQVDRFIAYYNEVRPHRALGRKTPAEAFSARIKAKPERNGDALARHYRVRHDRIDSSGTVTLRYRSRLYHVRLGRVHKGQRVLLLVADRDVRVLTVEGELLRQLTLDPSRDYQPLS
jgi:Integrase core domain